MKNVLQLALLAFSAALAVGCATVPQAPIDLAPQVLSTKGSRIGIATTALPEVDTYFFGADCLLCYAAASAANSSLTKHAKTLPLEELPILKNKLAGLLRKKGMDVFFIPDPVDLKSLPNSDSDNKEPNAAKKNFAAFKQQYDIDKLLVIDINLIGFARTYSSYIPTSDPKAKIRAEGYIINLTNNSYEWFLPLDVVKGSDGAWDEPPKFPGLTNAYFQAIEVCQDNLLRPFSN